MKTNIPYSNLRGWRDILELVTPAIKGMMDREHHYLVDYVKSNLKKKARVIESGTGSGRLLLAIAPYVGEAVGIEHEYLQVKSMDKLIQNARNVRVLYGSGLNIPYPADSFHLAFSTFNTLGNQSYDKFRFLGEMQRVVKPRRHVIVSVYAENASEYQVELYKKTGWKEDEIKIAGDFVVVDSETLGSHLSERFSKDKLARLFHDTGFTQFDIDHLTDFSYVVNARKDL